MHPLDKLTRNKKKRQKTMDNQKTMSGSSILGLIYIKQFRIYQNLNCSALQILIDCKKLQIKVKITVILCEESQ